MLAKVSAPSSRTTESLAAHSLERRDGRQASTILEPHWLWPATLILIASIGLLTATSCGKGDPKPGTPPAAPTVAIAASPTTVTTGNASTLTVAATNATQVVISDNIDSTTFNLPGTGGTQSVTPAATTIYTATATGPGGSATAKATVT